MKAIAKVLFILLISSSILLVAQPTARAQNVTAVPVFFHPYSVVMKEQNGSFLAYEGVDAMAGSGGSPTISTLSAQITGQTTVLGIPINYYSAGVLWGLRVPKDMHVMGTVTIRVYISSTSKVSGLTSGSGYGIIVADVDENNNPVEQFEFQAPNKIGGNVFASTPQLYSLSVDVDHVFKTGHAIGLAVGFGASSRGYNATVYFGSSNYPSGGILPIVDSTTNYDFTANSKPLRIRSNSAIADYVYDSAKTAFQFTARLIDYSSGFCNITVPKTLMRAPFSITCGSQQITPTVEETQTEYTLLFTHIRDSSLIQVAGTPVASQSTSPTSTSTPTPSPTQTSSPMSTAQIGSPSPSTSLPASPTSTSLPTGANQTPMETPPVPEMSTIALVALFSGVAISVSLYRRRKPF